MTPRRLLLLVLVALTGGPVLAAPPPPAVHPARPATPWFWLASNARPWRLPVASADALLVDDTLALVRAHDGDVMALSLVTGLAEAPVQLTTGGETLGPFVKVGGRLLGFGELYDGTPLAWEITVRPLAAHRIALSGPTPGEAAEPSYPRAVASPDGKTILICSLARWPVVRDAATLALVRVLPDVDCARPHWTDPTHVAFAAHKDPIEVDVTTGAHRELGRDEAKRLRARGLSGLTDLADLTPAALLATPGLLDIAVDGTHALQISGAFATLMDLKTGALHRADGNIGRIGQIAPRGGTLYVTSDRLRAYRAGVEVGTGHDAVTAFDAGTAGAPVVATGDQLETWTPSTNASRVVRAGIAGTFVTHAGSTLAFDDGDTVYRRFGDAEPTPWLHTKSGAQLAGVDVATERAAWHFRDADQIVDTTTGVVTAVQVPDYGGACGASQNLRFAGAGRHVVVETFSSLALLDVAGRWIAGLDNPPIAYGVWAVVPRTDDVVFAGADGIGMWSPHHGTTVLWTPPSRLAPSALGVSADGREVAVGFDDGSVLWADLAELGAHAAPVALTALPVNACAATPVVPAPLAELVELP